MPLLLQVYLSIYKSTYIFTPLAIKIVFLSLHACFTICLLKKIHKRCFIKKVITCWHFSLLFPICTMPLFKAFVMPYPWKW